MARLFVILPEDLHDRLRIESIRQKKTHGELVVDSLEKLFDFESQDKYTMKEVEDDTTQTITEGKEENGNSQ